MLERGSSSFTLAVLAVGVVLAPGSASGATITVGTTADEAAVANGRCALREAISAANTDAAVGGCPAGSASGTDTVRVRGGTYRLTIPPVNPLSDNATGDLDVDSKISLVHVGPNPATIDGGGLDRVMQFQSMEATISDLTIRNGAAPVGAGILSSGSYLTLEGVTLAGNVASLFGGGAASSGSGGILTLVNSTVSGNRAAEGGAGLYQGTQEMMALSGSTVTANIADADSNGSGDGGGIDPATGEVRLVDTIVAGNIDRGGEAPDCAGTLGSDGGNLLGIPLGCTLGGVKPSDVLNVPARLGALTDNGGPTPTHALRRGSRALGGGALCNKEDQRGLPRRLGGPRCDIGAYELARCRGVVVNRVGTAAADRLRGTPGADGLLGLSGRDVLRGRAGKDGLCGGAGRDRLFGGPGRDRLLGGPGGDRLRGGPGLDRQRQ